MDSEKQGGAVPDDGGPAFPVSSRVARGMSLRDYFAGQALVGLAVGGGFSSDTAMARRCYEVADALLAMRGSK